MSTILLHKTETKHTTRMMIIVFVVYFLCAAVVLETAGGDKSMSADRRRYSIYFRSALNLSLFLSRRNYFLFNSSHN